MDQDVFISHAGEDKESFARPLAKALEAGGLRVWFDEFTLRLGDELHQSIDHGLANSRYGLVILSPHFFAKEWPQTQLDGLVQRETAGKKAVLPVWHNITADQIKGYSPTLADQIAISSDHGLEHVVSEVLKVILPPLSFEPEMILIPAGEFLMGSDPNIEQDAQPDELPQHTVYLPNYYLAKTPVTNAQYAAFVRSGYEKPRHWPDSSQPPTDKEDHPVVRVSWHDAISYCKWLAEVAGKPYHLPSEAQWEKGARGTDGRIYPWGDRWDERRCNTVEGGQRDTTPVETYPQGASPYGLLDMAGNVWEWCQDWFAEDYYQHSPWQNPPGPEDEKKRVVRGGSWLLHERLVHCAYRGRRYPDFRDSTIGFRVAVSPSPPDSERATPSGPTEPASWVGGFSRGGLKGAKDSNGKDTASESIEAIESQSQDVGSPGLEPEMILIPAGKFLMGSDPGVDQDARPDEQPQHTVYLPDYYIAKTPVTNAQYAVFVWSDYHAPIHWASGEPPEGKEDHPVVNISWHDAAAYCNWLADVIGKPYRLPSEAEWEKAARGTDGRIYPWGNQWDETRCNSRESSIGGTTPVGAYPQGANPYGLLDMAGNVLEWCQDWFTEDYYHSSPSENPLGPAEGGLRVMRGGSWSFDQWFVRCAFRLGRLPTDRRLSLGFRVVASPSSP